MPGADQQAGCHPRGAGCRSPDRERHPDLTAVYLSIGSNIDREHNIRSSLAALGRHFGPLLCSSVYESAAVGFSGDPFYNMAVQFETGLALEEVSAILRGIEDTHGRRRGGARFSSRTLDIDILLYGALVRHDDRFDLPREEITEYAHVLRPLAEIAPDLRHPESGRRMDELWHVLSPTAQPLKVVDLPQNSS